MSPPLYFSEQYRVRISEVNAQHQLTIPALVNLLHEVAWQHSVALKVSVPDLLPRGISWVLSRMRLEIVSLPRLADSITLDSWIQANDRYFCYRDFEMRNAQGQVLLKATSVWGVLDMERRRIVAIPEWVLEAAAVNAERMPVPPAPSKLPTFDTSTFEQGFSVRWHDMDANNHVNNTCYFEWLVEGLPADFLTHHELNTLDIIFRAESTLHDSVEVQAALHDAAEPEQRVFLHKILNAHAKELVQARTVWVNQKRRPPNHAND